MEQPQRREAVVKLFDLLERAMGIEPTSEAWEASILPLYDARSLLNKSYHSLTCDRTCVALPG